MKGESILSIPEIAKILTIVTLIVVAIVVFGFLAFVRWGERTRKKDEERIRRLLDR